MKKYRLVLKYQVIRYEEDDLGSCFPIEKEDSPVKTYTKLFDEKGSIQGFIDEFKEGTKGYDRRIIRKSVLEYSPFDFQEEK